MKFPKPSFDFPDSCLRHHKFLPHGRRCQAPKFNLRTEASSQAGSTLRRRKFDDRTLPIDDDIDQRPPRCPRKSSRSPASPPASTVATYVHPEYPVVARDRVEEQNEIGGLEGCIEMANGKEHWLTGLACIQKVTPRQVKPRVSRTKGHLSKRTAFVRDVVKEVSGYGPLPHAMPPLAGTPPAGPGDILGIH